MFVKFLIIYIWLLLRNGVSGVTKTWMNCNTNADDRQNWVGGDYMKNCTGLHFPESLGEICRMSLGNITTSIIYLPQTANLEIRDSTDIIFSEESNDCIMVRSDLTRHKFNDPKCWANENRAVPDLERSPCPGDDAYFPSNASYQVDIDLVFSRLPRSVILEDADPKLYQPVPLFLFYEHYTCPFFWGRISNVLAEYDSRLCNVHEYNYDCNRRKYWREIRCLSPVYAEGHCTLFCGSVFLVEATEEFYIKRWFEKFFGNRDFDAYYSLINISSSGSLIYQVTMTDKGEFTGDSTFLAKEIYNEAIADLQSWNIHSLNASFPGLLLNPKKVFQNAMGILLGTLFAVVLLFSLMFLLYEGPLRHVNIIERLSAIHITKPSTRARKPFVFAKFENRDDGVTSICGSIVSLDKAFDNPMYGHQMASTSSGSVMEPVEEGQEMKEGSKVVSKSEFANPLYGEEDKIDVEDVDD